MTFKKMREIIFRISPNHGVENCWEGHFTHFLRKFKRHVWSLEVVNAAGCFLLMGHFAWDPVDPITALGEVRSCPI